MMSKQGDTLQGVGLTEGNIARTSGVFKKATSFYCIGDGVLKFTFASGNTRSYAYKENQAFSIICESITISTGTFNIGFD